MRVDTHREREGDSVSRRGAWGKGVASEWGRGLIGWRRAAARAGGRAGPVTEPFSMSRRGPSRGFFVVSNTLSDDCVIRHSFRSKREPRTLAKVEHEGRECREKNKTKNSRMRDLGAKVIIVPSTTCAFLMCSFSSPLPPKNQHHSPPKGVPDEPGVLHRLERVLGQRDGERDALAVGERPGPLV